MNKIKNIIKTKTQPGSTATLEHMELFDFIQLLHMAAQTTVIKITKSNQSQGHIFIKDGKIIHAEYHNEDGEKAFMAMIKLNKGLFYEQEWYEPNQRSIKMSTDELLLNAMIMIKESETFSFDQTLIFKIDQKIKKNSISINLY